MNNEVTNTSSIQKISSADLANLPLRARGRGKKKEKTPSLFDTPVTDRTYWGNDVGTTIAMGLVRIRIRQSLREHQMFDFYDDHYASLLGKENLQEMKDYEIQLMKEMFFEDGVSTFKMSNNDGTVVIEFDRENNKLYFRRKKS